MKSWRKSCKRIQESLHRAPTPDLRITHLHDILQSQSNSAYLIAQLGKNFRNGANEKITGE